MLVSDMKKIPKIRADQAVVEQGFADSRSKAQAMILAGIVYLDTRKIEKSGQTIAGDAKLEVKGKTHPWVSRGGIKLAHGLECFNISAKDGFFLKDVLVDDASKGPLTQYTFTNITTDHTLSVQTADKAQTNTTGAPHRLQLQRNRP